MKYIFFVFLNLIFTTLSGQVFEAQNLISSDGAGGDKMGSSVSISEDYLVVGAIHHAGIKENTGAAYVYKRNDKGVWEEKQKLIAPDGKPGDHFGFSVSISGDVIVVGAPFDDPKGQDSGTAYIFQRDSSGTWSLKQRFYAENAGPLDNFGFSVSAYEDYIAIGSRQGNDGVSDPSNHLIDNFGCVFMYKKQENQEWSMIQHLFASDRDNYDQFGFSIDLYEDQLVVGAPYDDENGGQSGAIYIYQRGEKTGWSNEKKLVAGLGDGGDYFGHSVSVFDNLIAVGAFRDDILGARAGAAYTYVMDSNGDWGSEQKLIAFDGDRDFGYGISVSISENILAVGAHKSEDSGDFPTGAVYLYERTENDWWSNYKKIIPSDSYEYDYFGSKVDLSGNYLIAGSPQDNNTNGETAGAAHIYQLNIPLDDSNCTTLYQNRPNPFLTETIIPFQLNKASLVKFYFRDANGRTIKTMICDLPGGYHELKINDLNYRGVLFYTLETSDFLATKKMIVFD